MPDTTNERPNILLIMSDEHDRGVTGCYGNPIVRTQNLDRLSDEGITFTDAYTTSPLCVPARLSFTAGKYISRCGAWSNSAWLPEPDYPSLPALLNASGYESVLGGKMHYDSTRRYGFRELFPSRHNDYHKSGGGRRRPVLDTSTAVKGWEGRSSDFNVSNHSRVLDDDREVTAKCSEFIACRKPEDKPFFLLAGYIAPHFPLICPQEYYDRYRDRVPMPNIPEGYIDNMPTNYKHVRYGFGLTETDPEVVKRGRALYYGLVDWFDDEVGKLLAALENSDVADNTVVIYCSDHGENKGDHGLWWKNNMYEHSAAMPLIVRWPKRWEGGQRRKGACSLVDLAQTIADLAGAEPPDDWDGDSLVPWLHNPDTEWKDLAVSEYYAHNIASGFAMIRQGPWKYVYHNRFDAEHGPERELYNLEDDPEEFSNRADCPEHLARIEAMHKVLVEELGREPGEAEAECRAQYAKGYERTDTQGQPSHKE